MTLLQLLRAFCVRSRKGNSPLDLILVAMLMGTPLIAQEQPVTVFYPVKVAAPGTIGIQRIVIPASYMIGQHTHTLSIVLNNNGGTCNTNQLVMGLEGSFDGSNWQQMGAPLSILTPTAGSQTGQLTGMTVAYGAYPFLSINITRAFGTNCITNIDYVGSATPVSFITSLPQFGDQVIQSFVVSSNCSLLNGCNLQGPVGLGSKVSIYGLTISNLDAATSTIYSLTIYNKPTGNCTGGTNTTVANYALGPKTTLAIGYSQLALFRAPTQALASGGISVASYDPTAGFYQICVSSVDSILSSVSVAYRPE